MVSLNLLLTDYTEAKADRFVRKVLGNHLGIDGNTLEILRNEYGKPYLRNHQDVHFNVSHAKDAMLCACADGSIGVDMERIHRVDKRIVNRFFSPAEQEYVLCDLDDSNLRFTEVWTRKEAYVKWLGTGIQLPIEPYDVMDLRHKTVAIDTQRFGDYVISLCTSRSFACLPNDLIPIVWRPDHSPSNLPFEDMVDE